MLNHCQQSQESGHHQYHNYEQEDMNYDSVRQDYTMNQVNYDCSKSGNELERIVTSGTVTQQQQQSRQEVSKRNQANVGHHNHQNINHNQDRKNGHHHQQQSYCDHNNPVDDFVTVVEVSSDPVSKESDFVTVVQVGDGTTTGTKIAAPLVETLTIYRLPGERLGMALKFEGGSASCPSERIDKVYIQTINAGSPASRVAGKKLAHLKEGDQILKIDGRHVHGMSRIECVNCLRDATVSISLTVKRIVNVVNGTSGEVIKTVAAVTPTRRMNGKNGGGKVPPPVPPRLATTTLTSASPDGKTNGSAVNGTIGINGGNKSPTSGQSNKVMNGTKKKVPPPLPPRRPRDPPPAAPNGGAGGIKSNNVRTGTSGSGGHNINNNFNNNPITNNGIKSSGHNNQSNYNTTATGTMNGHSGTSVSNPDNGRNQNLNQTSGHRTNNNKNNNSTISSSTSTPGDQNPDGTKNSGNYIGTGFTDPMVSKVSNYRPLNETKDEIMNGQQQSIVGTSTQQQPAVPDIYIDGLLTDETVKKFIDCINVLTNKFLF